ncbi:MAG: DUF3465 domain-containing protein [Gammaproteobacteria bacterium]|nr:DUF3465 domain-containing protein [Gammaproteobacteria bacterium]MDH4253758.1 DUF3465 domain-containing protein [Gammaproteobacteria bacterium]MDH5309687.1 DUF3465 domain-containing protein [Gammaproteobacteria bacterium]
MTGTRREPAGGSRRGPTLGKQDSGSWVEVSGRVLTLLPDDDVDGGHQRMLIDAGSGRTVLVAHNLGLSARVPVSLGDRVLVRGQFEWNERGGLIHWTHDDPFRKEPAGYIRLRGSTYR